MRCKILNRKESVDNFRVRKISVFSYDTTAVCLVIQVRRCVEKNVFAALSTFAVRVNGKEKSILRRPNCLHFETKTNLK